MKKLIVCFLTAVLFSSFSIFALGKKDAVIETVKTGTAEQLKKTLKKNSDFIGITSGADRETLLITAVKENRGIDIVSVLLKAGVDPAKKTKSGKTALMFACEHETDEAVIDKLINSGAFLKSSKRRRVLSKDKSGKTAFDYAKDGSQKEKFVSVLSKYAEDPAVTAEKKAMKLAEEEAAKKAAQENTAQDSKTDASAAEAETTAVAEASTSIAATAPLTAVSTTVSTTVSTATATTAASTLAPAASAAAKAPAVVSAAAITAAAATTVTAAATAPATTAPATSITTAPAHEHETKQQEAELPASKDNPVPEVYPYKKVYLFDYAELDDENLTELPEDNENDEKYTFIENADSLDKDGRTRLMTSSRDGDIQMIRNLLYSGGDVQATDEDGWTALMFASRYQNNPEVVQTLLKGGAVVTTKNKYGISALQLAAGFNKNPNILISLLNGRSIAEEEIRSSFIYAITLEATTSILKVFVDAGIPVNTALRGKTPLMYAAESNTNTNIIAWLLEHGANINYRTNSGLTAFDFAKQNKRLPHDKVYWSLNTAPAANKESN